HTRRAGGGRGGRTTREVAPGGGMVAGDTALMTPRALGMASPAMSAATTSSKLYLLHRRIGSPPTRPRFVPSDGQPCAPRRRPLAAEPRRGGDEEERDEGDGDIADAVDPGAVRERVHRPPLPYSRPKPSAKGRVVRLGPA